MSNTLTPIQTARKALIAAQQRIGTSRDACSDADRQHWDEYQTAIDALSAHEGQIARMQAVAVSPDGVKVLAEKAGLIEYIHPSDRTFYHLTVAPETTPILQRFAVLLLEAAIAGSPITQPAHPIIIEGEHVLEDVNVRLRRLLASAGFDPAAIAQDGEMPVFRNLLYLAETWKDRREVLIDALAKGVLEDLSPTCHCHEGYTSRKLRDPNCEHCNTNAAELRELAAMVMAEQLEAPAGNPP